MEMQQGMKWLWSVLMVCLLCGQGQARTVSDFALAGDIDGENITFSLTFAIDDIPRDGVVPLVQGDVAFVEGDFPRNTFLEKDANGFQLRFEKGVREGRPERIRLLFASRAERDDEWRQTSFEIPTSSIRSLSVACDRPDLDVEFPGALNMQRAMDGKGRTVITGNLGAGNQFMVRWKPQLKRLDADLVVSCDANTLATAGVGALRLDHTFRYTVIQGEMRELRLSVPDVSVTRVSGVDIQDWRLVEQEGGPQHLVVRLSRPYTDQYSLYVEAEKILPAFPCMSLLPVLSPIDTIRTSGFLLMGTDSAIKLQISKASGLTQIDPVSFPVAESRERHAPRRRLFAYQYANLPYGMAFTADDIVTTLNVDSYLTLRLEDAEVTLDAALEVDVKDAAASEIQIDMPNLEGWTVTQIAGREVADADADVRTENGQRVIYVPFSKPLLGTGLVKIRLERSLPAGANLVELPSLDVRDARSQRGYIVVASERGVQLSPLTADGLREIHTGSAPMQVEGAQHAYRFRDADWKLLMKSERAHPSLHCEALHLVSLGEGVTYSSVALTYHIGGAPVQELTVRVPAYIGDLDVTGADVESWTRKGELCTVRLQSRVMGDYTLLLTFDGQYDYQGDTIRIGGIETVGTESEVGYMVLSSAASIQVNEATNLPPSIIVIGREELPPEYAAPVVAPILKCYKYVRVPHAATLHVKPLPSETLLTQVADYVSLDTKIGARGGVETTVRYFLKNASRQYLAIAPPEGVQPWYAKRVYADGRKDSLTMQTRDGLWLVPVERPRDPNMAVTIEVTYAHQLSGVDSLRSMFIPVRMRSPQLPETHAPIADWTIHAADGLALSVAGGNMVPNGHYTGGLSGVWRAALRWVRAVVHPRYSLAQAFADRSGIPDTLQFTRTVNLVHGEAPQIQLYLVPGWMGGVGSPRALAVWIAIGLLVTIAGLMLRRWMVLSLGLAAILLAMSETSAGSTVVAAILLLALGLAVLRVAYLLLRAILRSLRQAASVRAERRAERAAAKQARQEQASIQNPPDPLGSPWEALPQQPDGFISIRQLLALFAILFAAISFASLATADSRQQTGMPGDQIVMDLVDIEIVVPRENEMLQEHSAEVRLAYTFRSDDPIRMFLLPPSCVVLDYELHEKDASLEVNDQGYFVHFGDDGEHRIDLSYRVPIQQKDGVSLIGLHLPDNMRNRVALQVPELHLDVRADQAVLFRTQEDGTNTLAEAVFGSVRNVQLGWKPRIRKTQLEDVVMFSEVNSWVVVKPGVLEFLHRVACRIAQGESRSLVFDIPEGMSITAVQAPDLATWRFEPETRKLDVVFRKPVSGERILALAAQVSAEGLPYTVSFGVPVLEGAARQRGAVSLSGPQSVQLRVDAAQALSPMNTEDFSEATMALAHEAHHGQQLTARRAFRYHQAADVKLSVHAEKVLPEIRVVESGSISVSDERTVLSTRLDLDITKAGIFDVELLMPPAFDLETLSGADVSQWDDVPATNGSRRVVVTFNRQIQGSTSLNLVVARMTQGVPRAFPLPKVAILDAVKHTGRVTVAAERGVRLTVKSHEGVDVRKAATVGIRTPGVLVFDLLRPAWDVQLGSDVLTPTIKPEVLQWVTLVEGMLQYNAYIQYRIENAGVKSFRLHCPSEQATMTVTGTGVSRVSRVEGEKGIWQVDLHGKVENGYSLRVAYQIPFRNEENRVVLESLRTVGTDDQRGYLVVTCDDRIQVQADGEVTGLKLEDARNVPSSFGAGDFSHAILCYRTVRPEFQLPLTVVRNQAAEVLPASVRHVQLRSVLSGDRSMLTAVDMKLHVGNLRFLEVTLPGEGALWTALVDGKEVAVSRKGKNFYLPLEASEGATETQVQFTYSGTYALEQERQHLVAPTFAGLPLRDIVWDVFVPHGMTCYSFDGTMEPAVTDVRVVSFDASEYQRRNQQEQEQTIAMARAVLSKGEMMLQQGNTLAARKAFEQAYNYSLGKQDLNEDARVQLRNLSKKQFKVGLFNRRAALRSDNNIVDQDWDEQGQQGQQIIHAPLTSQDGYGNFTEVQMLQVEEQLAEENAALDLVADKMVGQQVAAASVLKGIQVTLPTHGQLLRFTRDLQIAPDGALHISFKMRTAHVAGLMQKVLGLLGLAFLLWGAGRVCCIPRQ